MRENPFPKRTARLIRRVEVFGRGQSYAGSPRFLVEREESYSLIDDGLARRISKYKIVLTEKGEFAIKARFIQLRDRSAKPGLWLLDENAAGRPEAMAITEAWKPVFA